MPYYIFYNYDISDKDNCLSTGAGSANLNLNLLGGVETRLY